MVEEPVLRPGSDSEVARWAMKGVGPVAEDGEVLKSVKSGRDRRCGLYVRALFFVSH